MRTEARISFFLAVLLSLSVVLYRLFIFSTHEPTTWDVYSFLNLAKALSSFTFSDTLWLEGDRPLLLPLLAASLMLGGVKSAMAIYLPSAVIFFVGAVSFYLLLRMKLSPGLSLLGLTLFLVNPLVLDESASGMTNLPGTCLSILAIYLMLNARKRPSLYIAVLPVVLMAALTRYTAGIILLPVLLFLLTAEYRDRFIGLRRYLGRSTLLTAVFYVPFGIYFYVVIKSFFWPLLLSVHASRISSSLRPSVNHPELSYYLTRFPELISGNAFVGYIVSALGVAGILLVLIRIWSALDTKHRVFLTLVVPFFFLRNFFLVALALIPPFFSMLKRKDPPKDQNGAQSDVVDGQRTSAASGAQRYVLGNYQVVMVLWIIPFLAFHSISIIKLDRYFLTILPPLIIVALLFADELRLRFLAFTRSSAAWDGFRLGAVKSHFGLLTSLIFSLLLMYISSSLLSGLTPEQRSYTETGAQIKEVSMAYPELRQSSTASNIYPLHSWYLGHYVEPVSYYFSATRKGRITATEHKLNKGGYRYYLSVNNFELDGYRQFYKNDDLNLYYYARDDVVASNTPVIGLNRQNVALGNALPEVFFIGNGWQRNLESLSDYSFYLRFDLKPPSGLGGYRVGRSNYIDNYSLDELKRYPVIFAFNFRWHDRDRMEDLLRDYVAGGGVLVIDASGNLRSPLSSINLRDRRLFDVIISKFETGRMVSIDLTEPFRAPAELDLEAPLSGASYASERVLTSFDGKPVIVEQQIGQGRVIWVGAELFRAAVRQRDPQLLDLTKDVIAHALETTYVVSFPFKVTPLK